MLFVVPTPITQICLKNIVIDIICPYYKDNLGYQFFVFEILNNLNVYLIMNGKHTPLFIKYDYIFRYFYQKSFKNGKRSFKAQQFNRVCNPYVNFNLLILQTYKKKKGTAQSISLDRYAVAFANCPNQHEFQIFSLRCDTRSRIRRRLSDLDTVTNCMLQVYCSR